MDSENSRLHTLASTCSEFSNEKIYRLNDQVDQCSSGDDDVCISHGHLRFCETYSRVEVGWDDLIRDSNTLGIIQCWFADVNAGDNRGYSSGLGDLFAGLDILPIVSDVISCHICDSEFVVVCWPLCLQHVDFGLDETVLEGKSNKKFVSAILPQDFQKMDLICERQMAANRAR